MSSSSRSTATSDDHLHLDGDVDGIACQRLKLQNLDEKIVIKNNPYHPIRYSCMICTSMDNAEDFCDLGIALAHITDDSGSHIP